MMLKAVRDRSGLTQVEIAERTVIDDSYLSKLENDRFRPPAVPTILRLARGLVTTASPVCRGLKAPPPLRGEAARELR